MSTALRVSELNGIKVYCCTAGKATPEWANVKGSLRYNSEFRNRIELIQDFHFPQSSQVVKLSPNGEYVSASGVYSPSFKCFELRELSMKFERRIDAEVVDFTYLSSDFRKLAVLRSDRMIEIHAQYGIHQKLRIPKFGRKVAYDQSNVEVFIAAAGNEIYRLNLEDGRFLSGLLTSSPLGVNSVEVNPVHGLLSCGTESGVIECFDPRDKKKLSNVQIKQFIPSSSSACSVTSLAYDLDGLSLACGTSTGQILLFDLRSASPLLVKDHRNGLPIVHLDYYHDNQACNNIISADPKSMKIWNKSTGTPYTNIEAQADIKSFCVIPGSGLIMAACEHPRIQVYYIPSLGSAPKWASFLDSLTEELEEQGAPQTFEDYQFITRDQLIEFGAEHLIGTNLLRPYMHGFFMDIRLYRRIQSVAAPPNYEQLLAQQVKEKISKKTEERIVMKKKGPKVNESYAQQLIASVGKEENNPLEDSRFSAMFQSKDFEIDPTSETYQRLQLGAKSKKAAEKLSRLQQEEEESEEEEREKNEAKKKRKTEPEEMEDLNEQELYSEEEEDGLVDTARYQLVEKEKGKKRVRESSGPSLYESHQQAQILLPGSEQESAAMRAERSKLTLAERLALEQKQAETSKAPVQQQRPHGKFKKNQEKNERRGVESLGLKPFKEWSGGSRGRGRGQNSFRGGRGRGRGRG
jgi:ribosome biogenesis protein ENP2